MFQMFGGPRSERIRGPFSDFLDLFKTKGLVVVGQGSYREGELISSGPKSVTFMKDEKTFNWIECLGNLSYAVCHDFLSHPSTIYFSKTRDENGLGVLQRKVAPLPLALVCSGFLETVDKRWHTQTQAQPLALFLLQGSGASIVGGKDSEQVNNDALKLCKKLMLETEDTREWVQPFATLTREAIGKSLIEPGEYVILQARFTAAISAFYRTLETAVPKKSADIAVADYAKTFRELLEPNYLAILQAMKNKLSG